MVKKEVKIDSKGRILIPKELRDKLDLHEGDVLKVYVKGASIILKKSSEMKEKSLWSFIQDAKRSYIR